MLFRYTINLISIEWGLETWPAICREIALSEIPRNSCKFPFTSPFNRNMDFSVFLPVSCLVYSILFYKPGIFYQYSLQLFPGESLIYEEDALCFLNSGYWCITIFLNRLHFFFPITYSWSACSRGLSSLSKGLFSRNSFSILLIVSCIFVWCIEIFNSE